MISLTGLDIEDKSEYFYKLERLLLDGHSDWFYLHSIDFNLQTGDLLIEIGPNTNTTDKRKWLFTGVTNFSVANGEEYDEEDYEESGDGEDYEESGNEGDYEESDDEEFPKVIFGIDLYENGVAVIVCEDAKYSFEIVRLPKRVY
jgi:hypothetical protein